MYLPEVNVSFIFRITSHLIWRQPPWSLSTFKLSKTIKLWGLSCYSIETSTFVYIPLSFLHFSPLVVCVCCDCVSYNSGTPEGFIHHPFCPPDYCITESKYINLRDPDKQCDDNRSGLLCGKCNNGLSLVLGSSQCKECSNNYLALLILFALAGVLLVILLFLLNLTVAAGTLHGLIFYANIVAINHHIFPQSSNNPAVIFIAWLNLDLGIQTCFYDGMDAYAKTWLELVFPVYIWMIVGFLVYISSHSVVVTKLLGSRPVSVLATLFLLSYAKVLRTIIAALSLTVLHYPHKNVMVWV